MLSRRSFSNMTSIPRTSSNAGNQHLIKTAAMLIIGDEVLNGKIKDTNSQYFAQYCFELGINLRRVCVVPDETSDIVEVLNTLRSKFDFIATTGGIGPTHDDITYESIAKAYNLPLALDKNTVERMNALSENPPHLKKPDSPEQIAQLRMAQLPKGDEVKTLFVNEKLWVPVVSLSDQVYIFPGIPSLYKQLLEGLREHIVPRVDAPKSHRKYVSTLTPESQLAPILGGSQHRFADEGVKIGSYPHYNDKRNTVSISGPNASTLRKIVAELVPQIKDGHELTAEQEANSS